MIELLPAVLVLALGAVAFAQHFSSWDHSAEAAGVAFVYLVVPVLLGFIYALAAIVLNRLLGKPLGFASNWNEGCALIAATLLLVNVVLLVRAALGT